MNNSEDTSRLLDHLERHDALDRAREVLAALPADKPEPSVQAEPAGLDVERLALAVHALQWPEDHEHPEFNVRDDVPCWEIAQRLAAAYADADREAGE